MGWGSRKFLVVLLALAIAVAVPAQSVRFSLKQVWGGLNTQQKNPFYAYIENNGSDERGLITTTDEQELTRIEYPVELPGGSRKRVLLSLGGYYNNKVYLHLRNEVKTTTIPFPSDGDNSRIGLISDNPADLQFLRGQEDSRGENRGNGMGVGGCTPEDAPDRLVGYTCLDTLVLGDGSERLGDSQISAIRQFVLTGGVVVFIGGAAPSASSDPRWRDILPVGPTSIVTRQGLTERIGPLLIPSKPIPIQTGSASYCSYGVGLVSFLSCNPFETPVREAENRRAIMSKVLFRFHARQIQQLMLAQIGWQEDGSYYSSSPVAPVSVARASSPGAKTTFSRPPSEAPDPFQIHPPSVESIMWILIAYVVIVVPLNFFILKRMNRMELAWTTVPVLSVFFSLILLNSTINLYKADASTKSTGIAVLGAGPMSTLVFGKAEMFFPRAKTYDLGLKNVESVIEDRDAYSYRRTGGINVIDTGQEIVAPEVNTSNLAFKQFTYIQSNDTLTGLKFTLQKRDSKVLLSVNNQSGCEILDLTIFGPGTVMSKPESIKSGQTKLIEVQAVTQSVAPSKSEQNENSWQTVAATVPSHLVVHATLQGFRSGPKYGEGHPASRHSLVVVPKEERPL